MTGEEVSGPPGPKIFRLLYFIGAGVICTVAINKWRDYERKTLIQQQQQQLRNKEGGVTVAPKAEPLSDSTVPAVHKALK